MKSLARGSLALLALASVAGAQTPAPPSALPPVRPLGPAVHVSTELVGRATSALQLAHGQILMNDVLARRLILFDSTLAHARIIADSASGAEIPYGARPGALLPFRGDSALFVDPQSLALLIIDGDARVARVMSAPRADDVYLLTAGGQFGIPGFDTRGRLIYRGNIDRRPAPLTGMFMSADSAPIVRYDFDVRRLDTLTKYRLVQSRGVQGVGANGMHMIFMINDPMPLTDDWTVLPNGDVAVIRGSDYHIDWWRADGRRESSPKVPFPWRKLDDSTKIAFVDSLRAAATRKRADDAASPPAPSLSASGSAGGAAATPRPGVAEGVTRPPVEDMIAQPSELPDYAPPFLQGSARSDTEGNVWLKTSFAIAGRPIYDVINGKGALVDRVSLPANRAIAGFGAGVVYLAVREGPGARLETVRIK